jgi:hypothetical protein
MERGRAKETDLDPSELSDGWVRDDGCERHAFDDVFVPSEVHLGLTGGKVPYTT